MRAVAAGRSPGQRFRMLIDDIAEVLRSHHARPPAPESELEAFERAHGFKLDPALRTFYAASNGASLFRIEDSPYEILPVSQVVTGRVALFADHPPPCPEYVFAFCYVQDGNYMGFEVMPGQPYPIIDLFHETWPKYREVIAGSFEDFLHWALRSGGRHYWLGG